MNRKKKRVLGQGLRFKALQPVIAVFLLIMLVLTLVQKNVVYTAQKRTLDMLPPKEQEAAVLSDSEQEEENGKEKDAGSCLLLWEDDESGRSGRTEMEAILSQMKVPYDAVEVRDFEPQALSQYGSVVLSVTGLDLLGEGILDLMDWVKEGGSLMQLYPPETNSSFSLIQDKLGITSAGSGLVRVDRLRFTRPFMLGGEAKDYGITDAFESSLSVTLKEDCEVYVESVSENPVPVIWRRALGEGSIVVDNLGILEKAYRGIHCAAYSLLGEDCAWPVINGSVFYIDDFPSPVPEGDSTRIREDFGMNIREFYTQVWWNDVSSLAKEYGIRYTGLVIEQYSDEVEAPFERNNDIQRYQYFGNMLLDQGGEIGFHGYNHMPLVLENFDYRGEFDSYRQWPGVSDMEAAVQELKSFCTLLFPEEKFQVYVPPSNILSEEGRKLLAERIEGIRAIASVYLPGDLAYEQEFEEAEDGLIETPRTISGYLFDDYVQLTALAELNFHFVNSHFQHPDDALDEDRGAELGWKELFVRISNYTEWLYTAAPDIRNLTGSELAGAVQRYDRIRVQRKHTEEGLELSLENFYDEAWLMVRLNEWEPEQTQGGELTELLDGLYLLRADEDHVTITRKVTP